jgi:hypothetical protein
LQEAWVVVGLARIWGRQTVSAPLPKLSLERLAAQVTDDGELLRGEHASNLHLRKGAQSCKRLLRQGQLADARIDSRFVCGFGVDGLVERASRLPETPHERATFGFGLLTDGSYLRALFGRKTQTLKQTRVALPASARSSPPRVSLSRRLFVLRGGRHLREESLLRKTLRGGDEEKPREEGEPESRVEDLPCLFTH